MMAMTAAIASWAANGIDAWAGWMAALSWQLVPLLLIVAIADRALRRAGPVVRGALWWIVLVKLVLPPTLAVPAPFVPSAALADIGGHASAALPEGIVDTTATAVATATVAAMSAATTAAGATEAAIAPWRSMAFVVWASGVLIAAGVARGRYRRVRARCLAESDHAPRAVRRRAIAAARRLGFHRLPEIRLGPPLTPALSPLAGRGGVAGPAVVGFLSPIVIIPRTLVERRVELDHVLLHELAHVRRRDPIASLIALSAQIVFWFHPAIWCARRRLATLRELACDRTVARVLGEETTGYRRTLILLAQFAQTLHADAAGTTVRRGSAAGSGRLRRDDWHTGAPGTLGLFERQGQIVTRLEALARPVRMRRGTEWAASLLLGLAVLVSCAPLVPIAPARPSSTSPTAESPPSTLASAESPPSPALTMEALPPLDQLPGSLQKRYAVMRAMALEEQSRRPPG